MPVSSEISVSGPFYPNGVALSFAFEFKAASADEVTAFNQDFEPISSALYSVTLDDDEGGTLTFAAAPKIADYSAIYIASDPILTQPSDFDNAGPSFNPAAITRAFDRAAVRDLRQQRDIDRTIRVPFGEEPPEMGSIAGADGKVLAIANGKIVPIANDVAHAEDAAARADESADEAEFQHQQTAALRAQVATDKLATAAAVTAAQDVVQQVSDALATGTISDLVGTRIYTSRAALNADLVPADNLYALVVGDGTPANNDLYQKNGATTTGSWDGPLGIFASASAPAQAARDIILAYQQENDRAPLPAALGFLSSAEVDFLGVTRVVVDQLGRVVREYLGDGRLRDDPADAARLPLSTGDLRGMSAGPVDQFGRVLTGAVARDTGLLDARLQMLPVGNLFVDAGALKLFTGGAGDLTIAPASEAPDRAQQFGSVISYRRTAADTTGTANRRMAVAAVGPNVATGVDTLTLWPVYGQSLSCGGNIGTWAISTAPERPGRALMFGGGARLAHIASHRVTFEQIAGYRDLFEVDDNHGPAPMGQGGTLPGETPCTGFASALLDELGANHAVICNTFGVGSQGIGALSKGGVLYQNMLDGARQAWISAQVAGFDLVVPGMLFVWGEAAEGDSVATIQAAVAQLQDDITADIQAITGQGEEVILYWPQVSSFNSLVGGVPSAAQAALNLHLAYPTRFRCLGPLYQHGYVDTVHLTSEGTRRMAEDAGRKAGRLEDATSTATAMYLAAAVAVGTALTLTVAGAEGNLAIDTSLVSNPGQYGIDIVQDSGTPPTLSNIQVSGGTTITATLSGALGSNPKVRIGCNDIAGVGPTAGPRACIRDSAPGTRSDGSARRNYLSHQVIAIT